MSWMIFSVFAHLLVAQVELHLLLRLVHLALLPVERAEAEMGHIVGGIDLDGALQQLPCFVVLICLDQHLGQLRAGIAVILVQLESARIIGIGSLQIASPRREHAHRKLCLLVPWIRLQGSLKLRRSGGLHLVILRVEEQIAKLRVDTWKPRINPDGFAVDGDRLRSIALPGHFPGHRLVKLGASGLAMAMVRIARFTRSE